MCDNNIVVMTSKKGGEETPTQPCIYIKR